MATAIATAFLFPLNPTSLFSSKPFRSKPSLLFPSHLHPHRQTPHFSSLHASPSPAPSLSPINADYLTREFGGHGATFETIGDDGCVVKMSLDNGSTAAMMLPSGLITSYKPHMWHGSTVEVLHTFVSEGEEGGDVVVQGGVSLPLRFGTGDGRFSWCPTTWALHGVNGSSEDCVQVELISVDPEGTIEIKYAVSLREDLLGSELTITNLKSSSVQLLGCVISHLKVSTPDATYAFGLQGSNYLNRKPLQSCFSVVPPDLGVKGSSSTNQAWGRKAFQQLLSGWGGVGEEGTGSAYENVTEEEELEGEEEDNCTQMTENMSRIYTCAPREFTVVDRGRRNSVIIERSGFKEFYIFSPGSEYEWYGKFAYVCMGPSAMLTPIRLGPQDVWHGGLYLYNPNL